MAALCIITEYSLSYSQMHAEINRGKGNVYPDTGYTIYVSYK